LEGAFFDRHLLDLNLIVDTGSYFLMTWNLNFKNGGKQREQEAQNHRIAKPFPQSCFALCHSKSLPLFSHSTSQASHTGKVENMHKLRE